MIRLICLIGFVSLFAYLNAEIQPSNWKGSILYIHGEEDVNRLPLDDTTDGSADISTFVELDFNLTFFGHRFDHINIDNNGYFFFYEWGNTDFNYGAFPVIGYPFQADYPIIAPFYARVDINQN